MLSCRLPSGRHPRGPVRSRGFTLIELMVVIALLALVSSLAVPSFRSLILSQRVKTASMTLTSAAIMARSEAIKRNIDVVMAAAPAGWQAGWTISANGVILSQQEAQPEGVLMSSASTQIVYKSSGRLGDAVAAVKVSGDGDSHARCISFDLSGLPKSRLGVCTP